MNVIFQIIVILIPFLFESIVGNIVRVGNYSELNPKLCGRSRHSIGVDTKCFKWHKDILSPIKGALNVSLGNAPWVALIKYSVWLNKTKYKGACTGAVIADQWIITAAHCMDGAFNINIYLGYNFTKEKPSTANHYQADGQPSIHPDYNRIDKGYDLALVRMNKPINTGANQYLENSICLPEKWTGGDDCYTDPNKRMPCYEYGMLAGWGEGLHPGPTHLQIGYWRLDNFRFYKSKLSVKRLANQTTCTGDSGAPYWQYDMGRAVIVGVHSSASNDQMKCDKKPADDIMGSAWEMWVDQEIDWIKNVTMLK